MKLSLLVVGEPGAGIKTIMDMVTLTRLDCAVASSAIMRAGPLPN